MTPDEFLQALAALGWKQSDFCRRLDLDKNTPSRWTTGRTAIPRWVPEYLRAMLAIRRLHAEFVDVLPPDVPGLVVEAELAPVAHRSAAGISNA